MASNESMVLWDFVGFGVEALAGSRECVPAEASTPPEFLKTHESIPLKLGFEPEQGPIWLTMRGGDGVKAFIQAKMKFLLEEPRH